MPPIGQNPKKIDHELIAYSVKDQMKYLRREYGYDEVICNGSAGTVILFDGRGIHRGLPPRNGQRLLLVNYFDVRKDTDKKFKSGE